MALAAKYRLPAIFAMRGVVDDGYEQIRATASYADRIIKGEKPGNLPVQ